MTNLIKKKYYLLVSVALVLIIFSSTNVDSDGEVYDNLSENNKKSFPKIAESTQYPEEMVGYWRFDEGFDSTTYDLTENHNDGTLNGNPKWITGISGFGLEFDGDDYVECGTDLSLSILDTLTIEAWINPYDVSGMRTIIENRPDPLEKLYQFGILNGKLYFDRYDDYASGGEAISTIDIYPFEEWYHVAVVMHDSADIVRFYINGVEEVVDFPEPYQIGDGSAVAIGVDNHTDGYLNYFLGIMDEVAVYNGLLSPEEIQQHYLKGLSGLGYFEADIIPPETFLDVRGVQWFNGGYLDSISVSLWAEDNSNEINRTEYRFDTTTIWDIYVDSIEISDLGFTDFHYRSIDQEGNLEDFKTETFFIESSEVTDMYFVYGASYGLDNLDPHYVWDSASIEIINQVVETLFEYDLTYPETTIVPQLASDFGTWSLDGLEYTLTLKEGIQFHDGTDFNASAVKWNLDRLSNFMDTGQTQLGSVYRWTNGTKIIKNIEVVDTYIVKLILNEPFAALEPLLTFSGSGMMSPTSTPEFNHLDKHSEVLVGTGPYVYDEYIENIGVRYHAYENYRDGVADIENLAILSIRDTNLRHDALLSGIIDYIDAPLIDYIEDFMNNPDFQVESTQAVIIRYITMNNQRINKTFRQAISYAFNYSFIIDEIYGGYGADLQSPIPEGILYANDSFNYPYRNITRAREILIEAGICDFDIEADPEWLAAAASNTPIATFNFTSLENYAPHEKIGQELQDNLALIGIKVEFVYIQDFNKLLNITCSQNYDMFYIGWGADYNDPSNFINPLYASNSQSNFAQVDDPYLNNLMDQGLLETEPTAREAIYDTIQQYIIEDLMPVLYTTTNIYHDIYSTKYVGLKTNAFNRQLFYYVHLRTVVIETPAGDDITIVDEDHDIDISFDNVTDGGSVTITQLDEGPLPDTGFEFIGELYEITTDIIFEDHITISISYNEYQVVGEEADLKLMHWNGIEWEDITIEVDTVNNIIYGNTTSFSIFTIFDTLDKNPPESTLNLGDHFIDLNGDIYVTPDTEFELSATDELTDIDIIKYSINGGPWIDYTTPFTLDDTYDACTIEYYSVDKAGNAEEIKTIDVYVVSLETQSYVSRGESNPITFFDIIFKNDKQTGFYKLVATNPGLFFYHIDVLNNWPNTIESLTIEAVLPVDFVVHGTAPVFVYMDGIDITDSCIINGVLIEISNIPTGSEIAIIIHLEYALRGTDYPNLEDFGMTGYEFSTLMSAISGDPFIINDGLVEMSQSSVNLITHQKKTTAIAGFVKDINGNPIVGAEIELYDNYGTLIGTTYTDDTGFYYFIDIEAIDYVIHLTYISHTDIKYAIATEDDLTEIDFIILD